MATAVGHVHIGGPPLKHLHLNPFTITFQNDDNGGQVESLPVDPGKHDAMFWSEKSRAIFLWAVERLREDQELREAVLGPGAHLGTRLGPGGRPPAAPICFHAWNCNTECVATGKLPAECE